MIEPVQAVITEAEKFALELAQLLAENKMPEAQRRLTAYGKARNAAYWEVAAIADIASAMHHGRRWKKG